MGILRRLFTRDGYREAQADQQIAQRGREASNVEITEDEQRARDRFDKDFDERAAGRSD